MRSKGLASILTTIFAFTLSTLQSEAAPGFGPGPSSSSPSKAGASSKSVSVWTFSQHSQSNGEITVQICPQAVKLKMSNQPFSIVAAAPDWKVYAYNSSKGTYREWPKNGYRGLQKDMLFDAWMRDHQWIKVGEVNSKVPGLRLESFKIKDKPDLGMAEKTAIVGVTKAVSISPEALKVYNCTLKIPDFGKFPMEARIGKTLFGLSSSQYLSTSGGKKESVALSDFALPKGLKKVSDENRITEDGSSEGFVDLIPNN